MIALALAVRQRALDRDRVGRVDHDRRLDLVDQLLVEAIDVVQLVAVGVLQVDVDDLRAALDLASRDLAGLFVLLFGDQPLELARADLVRALADDERAVVIVGLDEIDAGEQRRACCARARAGACPRPSAASARMWAGVVPQQPPTMLSQPWSTKRSSTARCCVGRLAVVAVVVGQAGVREARDAEFARCAARLRSGRS